MNTLQWVSLVVMWLAVGANLVCVVINIRNLRRLRSNRKKLEGLIKDWQRKVDGLTNCD